ncbi:hypothetical protein Tco_0322255 [Tanacetum coccineum]
MNVCDLEEERRERSLDNNSYVEEYGLFFSCTLILEERSDFEMGGQVEGSRGSWRHIIRFIEKDFEFAERMGDEKYFHDVEVVSFVDVVFDGALGALGEEEVVMGEGVVVTSSSLEILTNNCLGEIMVSLIFLEGLDEEALVEVMVE